LALSANGEATALRIWLEFPDYNMQVIFGSFGLCVPEELTLNLSFGPFPMEWTGYLSADVDWGNATIPPKAILMP
jgi:hypothetical protein